MKPVRRVIRSAVCNAFAVLLMCLATAVAAEGADPEIEQLAEEISRQRAEIDRQAEELEPQETRVASTGPGFVADEPTLILTGDDLIADDFPGSFPVFGTDTRMRIGGYVNTDATFDFFVEVDFFTPPDSSAVLRLRHAYAVFGVRY